MTVAELMEILEDLDPDTEIRLAFQPNWPLEYATSDRHAVVEEDGKAPKLYLATAHQVGYLPGEVAEEIDW